MRRARFLAVLVLVLAANGRASADYPPAVNLSEQQPPTAEDWLRLQLRRRHRCEHTVCRPGTLVAFGEIRYYEGEPCPPCGSRCRGGYGLKHPAPYYIKEPTVDVCLPRAPSCRRPCW